MTYTRQKMQEVADLVINAMEQKVTDWIKPFSYQTKLSNGQSNTPQNLRGTYYSGINSLILGLKADAIGYKANKWATFKQINEAGGKINKGEKGTSVCYYGQATSKTTNEGGEEVTDTYRFLKFYSVFNIDQTTLEDKPIIVKPRPLVERIEHVEKFVAKTKANIVHDEAGSCYYRPATVTINMSPLDTWKNVGSNTKEELYYSTLLHELVHWTGTKNRCDRDKSNNVFGNEAYAFEELVAEFGSAMACGTLEITKEPSDQHAKYLNSWMRKIKDEPKAIFKATALAQKSIDYLYSLQKEQPVKEVA